MNRIVELLPAWDFETFCLSAGIAIMCAAFYLIVDGQIPAEEPPLLTDAEYDEREGSL